MKLHKKMEHGLAGIGVWGEGDDVALRVNFGVIEKGQDFPFDKLHYHKTRTTYFCVITGGLEVEVNGKIVTVTSDGMLEIPPDTKYRTVGVSTEGCNFVVIGSHNYDDKVDVI